MQKILFAAVLAAVSLGAAAETYEIDSFHTNARFSIDHFGTSSNVGGFYQLGGTMQFDAAKADGQISLTIPVKKLHSSSPQFTKHLLSADLFDAAKYPTIRFVSTKFHSADGKVTAVDGQLTMLGKTLPVTLKASKFNCYNSPMKQTQVCGGDFHASIDRTQWGMNYLADKGMTKTVELHIQVEAAKAGKGMAKGK